MIKQAIIMAGGLGSRFGGRTQEMPKGFIEIEDVAMVERSIQKLIGAGVEEIIIGTGHCHEWYDRLKEKYHIVKTFYNADYAKTSSMGTLAVCLPYIKGDVFLLESDLLYDAAILKALDNNKNPNLLALSGPTQSGDEVYVMIDEEEIVCAIDKSLLALHRYMEKIVCAIDKNKANLPMVAGELVGVSKLSKDFLFAMLSYYNENLPNTQKADYESIAAIVSNRNAKKSEHLLKLNIHKIQDLAWCEIDNESMLYNALVNVWPRIKENETLYAIRREVLLNPGPSTTTDSVKYAQVVPDICPREEEFGDIMQDIAANLTSLVAPLDLYTTVFFGGSGTAADEAMVSSCVPPNGKLLVVNNGSYGERLCKIAKVYNIDMDIFNSSTYEPIEIEKLKAQLLSKKYTTLAIVYHETTTGLLNPIYEICHIAKSLKITTIVDAVSAYAGLPMNLEDLAIDFASATSNKHIGGMAGVAFVVCRTNLLKEQKDWPMRSYYLNLYDQYKYFLENHQTRFTPPVQTLYALRQAIIETKVETIAKRYERFTSCWNILVAALKDIGLEMLVKEENQSHFITAVKIPKTPKYNFKDFHDIARKEGFTIYPGKLGNIDTFRIANMGDIKPYEMSHFVIIMKDYMKKIGV